MRLLRARLAAAGGSRHPGREARPSGAQPLPQVLKPAASKPAFDHPGPPNYPEVTSGVLIINAPRFASAAWAIVGPLLPQATRDKVSVLSLAASRATPHRHPHHSTFTLTLTTQPSLSPLTTHHSTFTLTKVSVLSPAASEEALAKLAAAAELPTFLGGSKPESHCFVSRAERVPEGLSEQLL
eukprot:scaffold32784_cov69-Phaeocystis_antarctica.AAC.6